MNDSDILLTFLTIKLNDICISAKKREVLSVCPLAGPFSFSFVQCNVQSSSVVFLNFEAVFQHRGHIFTQK